MSLVFTAGLSAELVENPYQAIAARDPFKLIRPPRKSDQAKAAAPPDFPAVTVRGVTDICGRPEALLEIIAAGKRRAAILRVGDSSADVEVRALDVRNAWVRVRFEGQERVFWLGSGLKFHGKAE